MVVGRDDLVTVAVAVIDIVHKFLNFPRERAQRGAAPHHLLPCNHNTHKSEWPLTLHQTLLFPLSSNNRRNPSRFSFPNVLHGLPALGVDRAGIWNLEVLYRDFPESSTEYLNQKGLLRPRGQWDGWLQEPSLYQHLHLRWFVPEVRKWPH